ncbi:facilitated trehalose transporter Tret1-like [Topomyia yanbarensis]|uniref:facilitated trehalose transporter Tret1-like n=1 Tax=Topomyia yanbarensis TaxID=2498891 RepID=UPI00273AFED8|nr:facilitated trehalose transporter Tret1-like [Topomyia yanbarensis]
MVYQHWNKYRNEYLASVAATLSVFMVVTTNAWSSPALPKLLSEDSPVPMTADEGSWMVAIQAIGAVFGPVIAALTVDHIGRKLTLLGTVLPVIIGWILIGVGDRVEYLYVARFLFGVSYGTVYSVSPIYLGEIASDAIRGSAGTLITVLAKLGFLAMYSVGPYLEYRTLAWISMVGPGLFVVCFIWMPETPFHRLARNDDVSAEKCLSWLRRSEKVSEELIAMKASVLISKEERGSVMELFASAYRNNMRILLILVFSMQMTGLLAILGYAQTIFEKISTNLEPEEMSIVLGAVQMVAVIFPAVLVDRMGRRPLLLLSTAGTTLGLLMCSIYFAIDDGGGNHGWIAFVSLMLYIVAYGLGLATVSFAILSEIFPKNIRAYATAAFAMLSALIVFGVAKMFQIALDEVGPYLPFAIFGICGAVSWLLIYLYIPETKGRTLDEIQRIVRGKSVR